MDTLLFRVELHCPQCGTPFRTRLIFKLLKWKCAQCDAEIYATGESYGSAVAVGALLSAGLYASLDALVFDFQHSNILSDPLWWFGILITGYLIAILTARFYLKLVAGKEIARGDWPCQKCGDLIPAKAFIPPWKIVCPHCHHRYAPSLLAHLKLILISSFASWALWSSVMMDRKISTVWPWIAFSALWLFLYFAFSPASLRPAQQK